MYENVCECATSYDIVQHIMTPCSTLYDSIRPCLTKWLPYDSILCATEDFTGETFIKFHSITQRALYVKCTYIVCTLYQLYVQCTYIVRTVPAGYLQKYANNHSNPRKTTHLKVVCGRAALSSIHTSQNCVETCLQMMVAGSFRRVLRLPPLLITG